jgi:hypothetical protein
MGCMLKHAYHGRGTVRFYKQREDGRDACSSMHTTGEARYGLQLIGGMGCMLEIACESCRGLWEAWSRDAS